MTKESLKEAIKQTITPMDDPAFAPAVFGLGILAASPFFGTFNDAFAANKAASDGGWNLGNWNWGGGESGGGESGDGGGGCGGCGGCGD